MSLIIDVHTHMYPPSYVQLLKKRSTVPYIRDVPGTEVSRLIILPDDDDDSKPSNARGRPLGPDYWDLQRKIDFMDAHEIEISVLSLANPWLDFLPATEAASLAREINRDLDASCAKYPGRLFAFGALPLSGGVNVIQQEIERLKHLSHMRGVVIGTSALGKGLDDPSMNPVWKSLESTDTLIFLHPHYGLPVSVFGPRSGEYGHVLPLALGFPLETTIAITRMYLSGAFDRFPRLQVLLAHSGGTLPFLAGRIESCIAHDGHLDACASRPRRSLWDVLKSNIYLDAVIYSEVGFKTAMEASGAERLMFANSADANAIPGEESEQASEKQNVAVVILTPML
ncbi:MAG: hypothetical protein Q9159_003496 [Coniocarpon cinnabarinum]